MVALPPSFAQRNLLYVHDGAERATGLEKALPVGMDAHAFVVLGYERKDGEMTEELMGRCEAAVGALCENSHGYTVHIAGNYCFDIEPSNELFQNDAKIAIRQLSSVLGLPRQAERPPKENTDRREVVCIV